MPRRLFDPKVFLFPTLALMGLLGLLTFAYFGSVRAAAVQAQSYNVKNQIRRAQVALLESKRAGRTYLLRASPTARARYEAAAAEYDSLHAALIEDIGDEPEQLTRLRRIDSVAELHLSYSEAVLTEANARERSLENVVTHMETTDVFMDYVRGVFDEMVREEDRWLDNRPSVQRRWRLGTLALVLLSVLLLLRSLYILYRRVGPLFDEVEQTREQLERANVNTLETLAKYKKLSAERAADVEAKDLALARNEVLLHELEIETDSLERIRSAVARELTDDLAALERDVTELIDLNATNTTPRAVELSMHLRRVLADMRAEVKELSGR